MSSANCSELSRMQALTAFVTAYFWLVAAVCQFLSHHLDGTDGKQARRTGSSTPLGELFDHGLDSWATLFLPVLLYSIFGRGPFGADVFDMYGIIWIIMITFILSHWEKYNTGILFLPWSYDLVQFAMTFVFLITYFSGPNFWHFSLKSIGWDVPMSQFIKYLINFSALALSLPFTFNNFINGFKAGTLKQKNVYEAMRPLIPTIYQIIIQHVWLTYSRANILEAEPRMFYWLTGTLFSNVSCRLIVAQMSSTRSEVFNWLLVPLTVCVAMVTLTNLSPLYEIYVLYAMTLLVTLAHVHYGICLVRQMCKHLNIYCFTITRRPRNID